MILTIYPHEALPMHEIRAMPGVVKAEETHGGFIDVTVDEAFTATLTNEARPVPDDTTLKPYHGLTGPVLKAQRTQWKGFTVTVDLTGQMPPTYHPQPWAYTATQYWINPGYPRATLDIEALRALFKRFEREGANP